MALAYLVRLHDQREGTLPHGYYELGSPDVLEGRNVSNREYKRQPFRDKIILTAQCAVKDPETGRYWSHRRTHHEPEELLGLREIFYGGVITTEEGDFFIADHTDVRRLWTRGRDASRSILLDRGMRRADGGEPLPEPIGTLYVAQGVSSGYFALLYETEGIYLPEQQEIVTMQEEPVTLEEVLLNHQRYAPWSIAYAAAKLGRHAPPQRL